MAIRTLWPLLAVVAVALWLRSGGAAFGDGPAPTVLEPLESSTIGTDRQSTILSVRLLNDQDQPLSGATVTFYMLTTVFGERLMKAGDAFTDATGTVVAEATTDADGVYAIDLPPGYYHVVPQPVEGLLGTAASVDVTTVANSTTVVDFSYDTGIR